MPGWSCHCNATATHIAPVRTQHAPVTGTSTYARKSWGGHPRCDLAPLTTSFGTVGQWERFLSNTGNAQQIRFLLASSSGQCRWPRSFRFANSHFRATVLYGDSFLWPIREQTCGGRCCSCRSANGINSTCEEYPVSLAPQAQHWLQSAACYVACGSPFLRSASGCMPYVVSSVARPCSMGLLSLCDVCICRELYAERRVVGGTATSFTIFMKCDVDIRK